MVEVKTLHMYFIPRATLRVTSPEFHHFIDKNYFEKQIKTQRAYYDHYKLSNERFRLTEEIMTDMYYFNTFMEPCT